MEDSRELGIIGEIEEDGLPVVFKFVDEAPTLEQRHRFHHLQLSMAELYLELGTQLVEAAGDALDVSATI